MSNLDQEPQARGVVFWNTWYRADAGAQLEYIHEIEADMVDNGTQDLLFCLSETSRGTQDSLAERLVDSGFNIDYRPTSDIGKGQQEGLAFARRAQLGLVNFIALSEARAIANTKTRWLGMMSMGDVKVFALHASYPRPTKREIDQLLIFANYDDAREGQTRQLVGGDFNTVIGGKALERRLAQAGLHKLYNSGETRRTIAWAPPPLHELDHAFASEAVAQEAVMRILPRGPSNHMPLAVTLDFANH